MNSGIFIVNKALEMSSNQLVQKIKRKFGLKKVGHAGTLDPLATGVMIILVNQATKLSDLLLNETKEYVVTLKLYSATTTGDVEGEVIETTPHLNLDESVIKTVLAKYQHYIYDQIPPIYSAIKKDGKKLYEYARKGESVEIKPRKVEIIETKFLGYNQAAGEVSFQTLVSKGTYIRSLATDIATDLQTVGHLTKLERIGSGNFSIDQAKSFDELSETDLIPTIEVVKQLPIAKFELSDEQVSKVLHGQKIHLPINEVQVFLIYNQQVVALYGQTELGWYQSIKNNLG